MRCSRIKTRSGCGRSTTLSVTSLKRAIEGRRESALASLYANEAIVQLIDRDNPPSRPRSLKGKGVIASCFEDVCGRDMTHEIEAGVSMGIASRHAKLRIFRRDEGVLFCDDRFEGRKDRMPGSRTSLGWVTIGWLAPRFALGSA